VNPPNASRPLVNDVRRALREYAKTDPDEVLRYVRANRDRLSPLSKREALKAALRSGALAEIP
jgi:3-methyladenine DNA glycosylase AlkD